MYKYKIKNHLKQYLSGLESISVKEDNTLHELNQSYKIKISMKINDHQLYFRHPLILESGLTDSELEKEVVKVADLFKKYQSDYTRRLLDPE